jgi:hypothetical protein
MAALAEAHARTVARFPRPHFDGSVLTWTDLAGGPDGCPDVPCAQESRFSPAGRSGLNPVTFCELAWHGITARGPQPADVDLWADQNALHAFTIDNLRTYWRPWWRLKRQPRPLALAIGLSAWFPVWAVLGVSRLHHLLATGTMTSKCGAGRYARDWRSEPNTPVYVQPYLPGQPPEGLNQEEAFRWLLETPGNTVPAARVKELTENVVRGAAGGTFPGGAE